MADVWMDDLFRIRSQCEMAGQTFFIRTLTAAESSDRAVYGREAARVMRERLKDPKEPDHQRYIAPVERLDKDELVEMLMTRHEIVLRREARTVVRPIGSPEPPKNAQLLDVIDAEIEAEEIEAHAEEQREVWVNNQLESYRKRIEKRKKPWLASEAVGATVGSLVEAEFYRAFNAFTIYAAFYRDKKTKVRWFATPEGVLEAGEWLYSKLVAEYNKLDRFSEDDERLKNLPFGQESSS